MHIFSAGPNSSDPYGKPTSPGKRKRPDEENITFAHKQIESLYSPEMEVSNPQTTPSKIDLSSSTANTGQIIAEDD